MRESGVTQHRITWTPGFYVLWATITARYGSRQLGDEWRAVVDDFGTLVPVQQITLRIASEIPACPMRYEITSKSPQGPDVSAQLAINKGAV